jgi:hypothetical protein
LVSRNIKNLKAIEISPDGNIVTLSGKNGAGKSAILDSIFSALTGTRLKDPVRHGEEKADVVIEMGEFTVRKRWTEKGEAIQVYTVNAEGKKQTYSSPQAFLDKVIGELCFDPLEFKGMAAQNQVELLKSIVGLDFSDLDKERDEVYTERSGLNSRIKESIAHLKNSEAPDPATPAEEISFKDALNRLNEFRQKQRTYQIALSRKDKFADDIVGMRTNIQQIDEEIAHLLENKKNLEAGIKELEISIAKEVLPPVVSEDDIRSAEIELEQLEKKNAEIRQAKRYREAIRNADKLKKESDELTEKLRRIDQDKQTRASAAKMPIEGLTLTDEGVVYTGILFDRLSTGQQIRVSTAIGMALNPKLKVIFIREGSLLDSAGLQEIAEMAKDQDYQVWIERCDESGQVGVYIEDGAVTAIDGKKVELAGQESLDTEE